MNEVVRRLWIVLLAGCLCALVSGTGHAESSRLDELGIVPATFGKFINSDSYKTIILNKSGRMAFSATYKVQGVKELHGITIKVRFTHPASGGEKQDELTNVMINDALTSQTYVSKTRQAWVTVSLSDRVAAKYVTQQDLEPLARHILGNIEARSIPWPDYVVMAQLPETIGRYNLYRWYLWDKDISDGFTYMQLTVYYKTPYTRDATSSKEFEIRVVYAGPDDQLPNSQPIEKLAKTYSPGEAKFVYSSPTHVIATAHSTEQTIKKLDGMLSGAEEKAFDQLARDLLKRLSPLAMERIEGLELIEHTVDAKRLPPSRANDGSTSPPRQEVARTTPSDSNSGDARAPLPPTTSSLDEGERRPSGSTDRGAEGPAVSTDEVVVVTFLTSLIIAGLGIGLSFSQAVTTAILAAMQSGLEVAGQQVVEAVNRVAVPPQDSESAREETDVPIIPGSEQEDLVPSVDDSNELPEENASDDNDSSAEQELVEEDEDLVPSLESQDPAATNHSQSSQETDSEGDPDLRVAAQQQRDAGQREINEQNSWEGTMQTMLDGIAHSGRDTATVLGDAWRVATDPDNYQALVEGTIETIADITGLSNNAVVNEVLETMNPDRMSVPEKVTQGGEFFRDVVAGTGQLAGDFVGEQVDADPSVVVAVDVLSTLGGKVVAPGAQTIFDPDADQRVRDTILHNGEQVLTGLQRIGEMGANGATKIVETAIGLDRFREAVDGNNDPTTRVQNALLGALDLATTLHGVGGKVGELVERAGDVASTVRTGARATDAISDGGKLEDAIRAGGRTLDEGIPATGRLADDVPTGKVVPPEGGGGNRILNDGPTDPTDLGPGPAQRPTNFDPDSASRGPRQPTPETSGPNAIDDASGPTVPPARGEPTTGGRGHYDPPLSPRHVDPQDPRYVPPGTPADEVHTPPSDWSRPVPDPIAPTEPIPTRPRVQDPGGIDPGRVDLGDLPPERQPELPDAPRGGAPDDDVVPSSARRGEPNPTETPARPTFEVPAEEADQLRDRRAQLQAARDGSLDDPDLVSQLDQRIADIDERLAGRREPITGPRPADVDPAPRQRPQVEVDPPPAEVTPGMPDDGVHEIPISHERVEFILADLDSAAPPRPPGPPQQVPAVVVEEAQAMLPPVNRVIQSRDNGCFEAVTASATRRPLGDVQAASSRWFDGFTTDPDKAIPGNQIEGFLNEVKANPRRPIAAMDDAEAAHVALSRQLRRENLSPEEFQQARDQLAALGDRETLLRQAVDRNPELLAASLDEGNMVIGMTHRPHMVSIQGYQRDSLQNIWLRIVDPDKNAINDGIQYMRLDDAIERLNWRTAYRVD